MKMLDIGVSIPSDEEIIREVPALGISSVELAYFPPLEGRIDSLSKALLRSGVKAASFHAPYGPSCDIGNFDEAQRRIALDQHRKHIQYCASLDSQYYVIHPGFDTYLLNGGGSWDDVRKVAIFPREESTIGRLWETNASSLAELADLCYFPPPHISLCSKRPSSRPKATIASL